MNSACHPISEPAVRPAISVLAVSWNDWPKLEVCLRSIFRLTPAEIEVIVISNAGTDDTPDRVKREFPQVRLIQNSCNVGHTKAVNQGFRLCRGRYILLLDSDTELLGDCFLQLYTYLEEHADVSLIAPRTFNTDGSIQESARNFPTPLGGLFGRQSTLTRLFPNNSITRSYLRRDTLGATEPFQVEQVGGAAMFFRADLLERYGFWDEHYFGYWVDSDWCRRLATGNERIVCVPAAHLRHDEMNSRRKRKSIKRIWVFHYGAWRFYTQWYTFGCGDPRSMVAGLALLMRTGIKIATNCIPIRAEQPPMSPTVTASYRRL